MRVNVSLECSYWSCIKSHCYIPIQQRARWRKKKARERESDQMSWWQHAALSKVALSIKIDREGEGRYFSRTPTVWHFRKAVLSILSPSIVARKEHGCLDWGNLSHGLRTQQRRWTGFGCSAARREPRLFYLSAVISPFACGFREGGLSINQASCFDILKASLSNLISR